MYYILGKHQVTIGRGARGPLGMMARVYKNRVVIGKAVVDQLKLKPGTRYRISILKKAPIELRLEPAS